jgi:phosphatidylserine/phosphatidylglycerophosphate/cardiolipin synthase-like enzyme
MQLLVQPDDGIGPILTAIRNARRTIDLLAFRLASNQIEKALADAVKRGVEVRTLVAHTHGGKGKALRKLELRLLKIGATVKHAQVVKQIADVFAADWAQTEAGKEEAA